MTPVAAPKGIACNECGSKRGLVRLKGSRFYWCRKCRTSVDVRLGAGDKV